jgi:hypothetical protein
MGKISQAIVSLEVHFADKSERLRNAWVKNLRLTQAACNVKRRTVVVLPRFIFAESVLIQ